MSNIKTEQCRLRYVSNHFPKYHRMYVFNLNCFRGTANFKWPLSGISAELANPALKPYFIKTLKPNYIHQTKSWDWVESDKYVPHRHSPENYSRTQLCLRMGLANRLGFFQCWNFLNGTIWYMMPSTSGYWTATNISIFTILLFAGGFWIKLQVLGECIKIELTFIW